ncbi:hypothetical protein TWF970_004121 [Orbilia oligospora]|uniref:Zinc-binding loop region of homing endonuclease domain-containing protein n=1 Tax=Orbilia oligospora TaxID=2813651 RepID=A0A7C8V699_ORBOL|nr:hypothetical protein TWF970_004121 [Orbilia oligospora]
MACRVICLPDHVLGHLKKNHMFERAKLKRAGLLIHVKSREWASAEQIQRLITFLIQNQPRPLEPFQILPGWQCPVCFKCYKSKESLNTHRHTSKSCSEQLNEAKTPNVLLKTPVQCQRIFGHKHGMLIRVYPRVGERPAVDVGSEELNFLRDRRAATVNASAMNSDPSNKKDPWLARTGWLAFCGGDSSFVAKILCPLTAARGRCPKLGRIGAATRSLLKKSLRYIGETSDYYLRQLETPGPHRYAKDLFGCQQEKTQIWYIDTFVRMVLYICSLSQQKKCVIRKSEATLEEFHDSISLVLSYAADCSVNQSDDEMEKRILTLVVQCLTTKIPANSNSRFQHPVINFLAVEGYDERNGKWRDARHTTQHLAAMSFCTKLSILAWSWESAKSSEKLNTEVGRFISESGVCDWNQNDNDEEDDDQEDEHGDPNRANTPEREQERCVQRMVTHRFREEFGEVIEATKDGLDYPMSEWMSQHAYGKAISDNSLLNGHIYWNTDDTILSYNGEDFDILEYRQFAGSITEKINGLLLKMFFEKTPPTIPLQELFDNPANYIPGYGLRTEPRNSQWLDFCLLSRIIQTPELRNLYYPNGSNTLCRIAISGYLQLDLEIQLWFAIAILLTSGAPPRGTEVLALLKYNTATRRRNIFVVDGEVMILSSYNKIQGLTGHASPIYRFLPKNIGEQLILYLFYVEPLADLFQHRLTKYNSGSKGEDGPSPLLFTPFEKDSRSWKTSMMSIFLKRETELAINFPLQLSNYRQIIAAVVRTHIQEMADIIDGHLEQTKSKLIEQFGHCYQTNVGHYGVTNSRIPETEEISMKKFRRATMHFQFFLGVIPALPNWMFQPSVRLYPPTNGPHCPPLHISHLCNNPPCFNPKHLTSESREENISRQPCHRMESSTICTHKPPCLRAELAEESRPERSADPEPPETYKSVIDLLDAEFSHGSFL